MNSFSILKSFSTLLTSGFFKNASTASLYFLFKSFMLCFYSSSDISAFSKIGFSDKSSDTKTKLPLIYADYMSFTRLNDAWTSSL